MDFPVATLGLGFILGLKHTLDADHLVAISTIVSDLRSIWRSALAGAYWGLGHTFSLAGVGVAVILMRLTITEHMAFWMEMGAAAMLVTLGSRLALRAVRRGIWNRLEHGDIAHDHLHAHPHGHSADREGDKRISRFARLPFLVGMVHGLAGSAALMLLVLATIESPWVAGLYIVMFGIGSVVGMLVVSSVISLPAALLSDRLSILSGRFHLLVGFASVAFGLFIALRLTANPA